MTGTGEGQRNRLGIAKTFQHSSLFDAATCRENVFIGIARRDRLARRWWRSANSEKGAWSDVDELLVRVGLAHRAPHRAGDLSHGERRQLEVAVALATRPRLLLLDEPTAGMSASETQLFVRHVQTLAPDITVVIIEHDLDVVFSLAERVTVLAAGRVVLTDTPERVRGSAAVQEAYLGAASSDDLFIDEGVNQ